MEIPPVFPSTKLHSHTSTGRYTSPTGCSGSRTITPFSELPLGSYNITVSSLTMKRINQLKQALQPLLTKPKVQDSKSSHAPMPTVTWLTFKNFVMHRLTTYTVYHNLDSLTSYLRT